MKQLVFLFFAMILTAQNAFPKVRAAELPASQLAAAQTLRSVGNRRLLQDTVVSDYTAWCTPSRDTTPAYDGIKTPAYVFLPYDVILLQAAVDLCNSAVFNINGQDVKLPATVTGSVTETALPDGRRVTVALQISGVYAPMEGAPIDDLSVYAVSTLGIDYFNNVEFDGSIKYDLVTSGFSKEEFFKTLAVVQSLTYTLKFELHDNSKPGAPITTYYYDIFDPANGNNVTFISEQFSNLVIKGPLRRSPLYPNVPVGNPAVFTINQLALANGTTFNEVSANILPPDDGSVLETLKKEFGNFNPDFLLLGASTEPNVTGTATPAPTGTATATPVPTGTSAVPTGTSAPAGIPPVNGVCDPYGSAPNQCFAASGGASICCPGQCPAPGATPSCASTVSPTGNPTPSSTTSSPTGGPTPTPTSSSSAPVTPAPTNPGQSSPPVTGVCDPNSDTPNQCFDASGSASICCAGQCPAPGANPSCTSATAAPTTGSPSPTASTGPTPTPTASASSAPSTVCDPKSTLPNQCFNSGGNAFVCCAGACGASGPEPVCAT